MAKLLIVHHSPTSAVLALHDAVLAGAMHPDLESKVQVRSVAALDATATDLLDADAYVLGTTANFGYISGALKHFFDTTFYAASEATKKRPFSYWIHGKFDTTGAQNAMTTITNGYGWRLAAEPLVFVGEVTAAHEAQAEMLGASLAAHVGELGLNQTPEAGEGT